jgi:hypothetical protein
VVALITPLLLLKQVLPALVVCAVLVLVVLVVRLRWELMIRLVAMETLLMLMLLLIDAALVVAGVARHLVDKTVVAASAAAVRHPRSSL